MPIQKLVIHVNAFSKKIEGGYIAWFEGATYIGKDGGYLNREDALKALLANDLPVAILHV